MRRLRFDRRTLPDVELAIRAILFRICTPTSNFICHGGMTNADIETLLKFLRELLSSVATLYFRKKIWVKADSELRKEGAGQ